MRTASMSTACMSGASERLELHVDFVSTKPDTPYLITHTIAAANGRAYGGSIITYWHDTKSGVRQRFDDTFR